MPWFTDLDRLVRETDPEVGIVSVAYGANGEVGLMAVEAGLHVLLETPIAHKLSEADAIIAAAHAREQKIEVAEQFHRRPLEQIKLKLIEAGVFGRIYASFNDFAGHAYHGISVMRSYLGFDAVPVQVTGSVQDYALAPHWSRLANEHGPRTESQEHGIIEFEDGQLGHLPLDQRRLRRSVALVAQQPLPGREGYGHHHRPLSRPGGAVVHRHPGR